MTLMVVLIICLLSHYWLPALAFLSRLGHAQRDQATQMVGDAVRAARITGRKMDIGRENQKPLLTASHYFNINLITLSIL